MTSLDWWNLMAYVVFVWNIAGGNEFYIHMYNRAVIELRGVA